MDIRFDSLFTPPQLKFLADTVQIGTDAYALLTQNADSPFSHLYMRPEGTRIRTKLMQMQVAPWRCFAAVSIRLFGTALRRRASHPAVGE